MSDNTEYPDDRDMYDLKMGYVRLLHAVPDAPNVDVYANNNLIIDNFSFGEWTDYFMVPEGTYQLTVYATGTKDSPVASNMLNVNEESVFTVAAVGTLSNIELLAIKDANSSMSSEQSSMVRFLHLSPNAPAVDITLPDGTVIFSNVSFRGITPYIDVEPMNYTLQVRLSGTTTVVLTVPDIVLEEGEFYTIYAIGLAGGSPELEALVLVDGDL